MSILTKTELENWDQKKRLNLINSIGGIKPANLIGTISKSGKTNLAIFFSVLHVQSHPAQLAFLLRPTDEQRRDSWENIQETGVFTVNAITSNLSERAHYTSAKFPEEVSEFDSCHIKPLFSQNLIAPYVAESPIKIGCRFEEHHYLKSSRTTLVVGTIEEIIIDEYFIDPRGYLAFDKMNLVGIGGLNSYYKVEKTAEFPYARLENLPIFTDY
ncbi:MAG: flavin reductase [Bacteroidales bacterium]|nr:flavin reductase [Bacteroidales bacterium]